MPLFTTIIAKKLSGYKAGNMKGKVCLVSTMLMFYNENVAVYCL